MKTIATQNGNDRVVVSSYGDPASRVVGANAYQRFPERSSWTESEIRERADGSRYRMTRSASRWGGEFVYGDWTPDAGWVARKAPDVFSVQSVTSTDAGPPDAVNVAIIFSRARSYQQAADSDPSFAAAMDCLYDAK